jgi:anti-anti-sigma factor
MLFNCFVIAYPRPMTRGELVWRVAARGATRVVAPAGRVDEASATAFADRLSDEIDAAIAASATTLAIDLAAIDYMSSRGLRGLTLAQRRAGEASMGIVLVRPNAAMREILAISRYDKVFPVVDDIDSV